MTLYSASEAEGSGLLNVSLVLPDGEQIPYLRSDPGIGWDDAEFSEVDVPGQLSAR